METAGAKVEGRWASTAMLRVREQITDWLGSLSRTRFYAALIACVTVSCVAIYLLGVSPALGRYREAQRGVQELAGMAAYRDALLVRIERTQAVTTAVIRRSSPDPSSFGHERILGAMHTLAGQIGVSITAFAKNGVGSSVSPGSADECHVVTHGEFDKLQEFVTAISQEEPSILIAELVLENGKWPDFDGDLRATIVLRIKQS